MTNPPLRELMKKVDSKYTLVIASAKRARQLVSQKEATVFQLHKPVTRALMEICEGKVRIRRKSGGEAGVEKGTAGAP